MELKTFNFIPNRVITTNIMHQSIGQFRVPPTPCIKTRLSVQPLLWKWFFILTQIKLIFKRKVVQLDSFWKWRSLPITTHDSYTCTAMTINSKWTDEDTVNEWQSLRKLIKLKLWQTYMFAVILVFVIVLQTTNIVIRGQVNFCDKETIQFFLTTYSC